MEKKRQRLLSLIVMVIVGTIIIILDAPLELAMIVALLAGFGILQASERIGRRDAGRGPERKDKAAAVKGSVKESGAASGTGPHGGVFSGVGARISTSELLKRVRTGTTRVGNLFSVLRKDIARYLHVLKRREKEEEKIDRELNQLIDEHPAKVSSSGSPASVAAMPLQKDENAEADPFSALANAEVDEELIVPTVDEVELATPSMPPASEKSSQSTGATEGSGTTAGVVEPSAPDEAVPVKTGEDSGEDPFAGLNDLELEGVDLESIVPEGDTAAPPVEPATKGEAGAGANIPSVPQPQTAAQTAKVEERPKSADTIQPDFLTAPNGDVLSILKDEISKVKKEKDLSLLRDLKDQSFKAEELVREMNEILELLPSKKSPKGKKEAMG